MISNRGLAITTSIPKRMVVTNMVNCSGPMPKTFVCSGTIRPASTCVGSISLPFTWELTSGTLP